MQKKLDLQKKRRSILSSYKNALSLSPPHTKQKVLRLSQPANSSKQLRNICALLHCRRRVSLENKNVKYSNVSLDVN